jgi:hypothetical protein
MTNRKKTNAFCFVAFVLFLSGLSVLHAEAPELRKVMPNSWHKVTRLTATEEQAFLWENSAAMDEIKKSENRDLGWDNEGRRYNHYFIYRQAVGRDEFHRVVCTDTGSSNFLSPGVHFWQFLVYRGTVLEGRSYNEIEVWQRFTWDRYYSIDILAGNGGAKGILVTGVAVEVRGDDSTRWSDYAYRKGQLFGYLRDCRYYLMEEAIKKANGEQYTAISIEASDCLIDPEIPLRYSVQNAFDGDPATSYVENTENDLMTITLSGEFFWNKNVAKFAIINGYAQNTSLYVKNNRIKKIVFYKVNPARINEPNNVDITERILSDNQLSYQIVNSNHQSLRVKEIYKGTDYNDTCVAEFDLYIDGFGWLFGGIENE